MSAPPVVGPVFSQFNLAANKRVSARLLKQRISTIGAPVVEPDEHGVLPASSPVVVNIYAKTSLRIDFRLAEPARWAGDVCGWRSRRSHRCRWPLMPTS